MCLSQLIPLLDGLCESPHDYPPRWAALLSVYMDESMEPNDGFVVIAGFVGNKSAWVRCGRRWRKELGARGPLHMKELRGWNDDRHRSLLERMGTIPAACGLSLVYVSLRVGDYRDMIEGTLTELSNEGYIMAMRILVIRILQSLPPGQRLEVICETQNAFAARREFALRLLTEMPTHQDRHGMPKLAKWSSAPKSTLFEPCDFAAYALLQQLREPNSHKAILCSPILTRPAPFSLHIGREEMRGYMDKMKALRPDIFQPTTKEARNETHRLIGDITGVNKRLRP